MKDRLRKGDSSMPEPPIGVHLQQVERGDIRPRAESVLFRQARDLRRNNFSRPVEHNGTRLLWEAMHEPPDDVPRNGGQPDGQAAGPPATPGNAQRESGLWGHAPVFKPDSGPREGLNHVAWAGEACITAFGLRVGIRVSAPELLDRLLGHIPTGWKCALPQSVDRLYSLISRGPSLGPDVGGSHLLYVNDQRLARTGDPGRLVETFESDLNSYIAQTAQQWFFVHAGVVGWKGQAIIIPGHSYSGKTVLVKEFLQAGAKYYSDEFAAVDGHGWVHPFPRLLSVRAEDCQTHTRIRAEDLGSETGTGPLPVGLLLLTRYKAGADWRPRVLSPGRGVLALLANALTARSQPALALATFERATVRARVLKSIRGDAKETVESVLKYLDRQVLGNTSRQSASLELI